MKNFLMALVVLFFQSIASASEPLSNAFDSLIDKFQTDVPLLAKLTTRSTVAKIESSDNIDASIREYILKRLESTGAAGSEGVRFVQCKDCFTVRAQTEGENVIVKKGVTSREEILKMTQSLDINSYAEVQALYSGTRVVLIVNVYSVKDASVLWAKEYETRLLSSGQMGLRFSATAMQGFGMEVDGYPLGLTLTGGERIYGIGTLGLYLQYLSSNGAYKSYTAIGPSAEFNLSEIFDSHPSWGSLSTLVRLGFGWYGSKRDFNMGAGLKVNYGSLFHITLDAAAGIGMPAAGSDAEGSVSSDGDSVQSDFLPTLLLIGFGVDLG